MDEIEDYQILLDSITKINVQTTEEEGIIHYNR